MFRGNWSNIGKVRNFRLITLFQIQEHHGGVYILNSLLSAYFSISLGKTQTISYNLSITKSIHLFCKGECRNIAKTCVSILAKKTSLDSLEHSKHAPLQIDPTNGISAATVLRASVNHIYDSFTKKHKIFPEKF